jgi:hypothetical protein
VKSLDCDNEKVDEVMWKLGAKGAEDLAKMIYYKGVNL